MNIALHIAQRMKLKNHLGIFIVSYQERNLFYVYRTSGSKGKMFVHYVHYFCIWCDLLPFDLFNLHFGNECVIQSKKFHK